ncbi:hypothetical protein FXF51_56750 [Nonomuraea sp. PA05]|uniref:hypothetical protein n=1 Tax=Nonomuraea sp. PA05 TaxID=2604466 RepID=UPI0011D9460D|nr:hypothetical protein [Nonomuraea sp. PA05]TYB50232.1 hypothetical protein FXF51_56750 [Nonomuraea sp. PA05]
MPGNVQGFTPADLARLRSVHTNPGHTTPHVREQRHGLRVVRVVRRMTDSGAVVTTREFGNRRDVHVHAPLIVGRLR